METARNARKDLDAAVLANYGDLQEIEIKSPAVVDKWYVTEQKTIDGEVERIRQSVPDRGKELDERYGLQFPALSESVEVVSLGLKNIFGRWGRP